MNFIAEVRNRHGLERKKMYLDILKSLLYIKNKVSVDQCLSKVSEKELLALQHDLMDVIESGTLSGSESDDMYKGLEAIELCVLIKRIIANESKTKSPMTLEMVNKFMHIIDEQTKYIKDYLRA